VVSYRKYKLQWSKWWTKKITIRRVIPKLARDYHFHIFGRRNSSWGIFGRYNTLALTL